MQRVFHPGMPCLALILLATLPYLRGLSAGFVYDDEGSIVENRFLEEPTALRDVLTGRTYLDPTIPDGRRPAVIVTYLADRAMWGLRATGYHATNLLLHVLCVLAFHGLIRRLAAAPFVAFSAAALFAFHPVNVEAVQSPAFREDLLVCLFVLLFLAAARAQRAHAWLALPLAVLALVSKESALVAWPLLGWMGICFPAAAEDRKRTFMIGWVSLVAVALVLPLWARGGGLQAWGAPAGLGLPFPQNLWTAPRLWMRALRWLAWPWPLIADHVVDPVPGWSSPFFWAPVLFMLGWGIWAFRWRHRAPEVSLAMGWLWLGFLPVSNLLPLYNPFAERYLYLLTPALAWLVAAGLGRWRMPLARSAVLAALCALYALLVLWRLPDWMTNATLWHRTLEQEPRSARAHTWVALDLKRQGARDRARRLFEEADRLNPRDTSALVNLAVLAGEEGRLEEALGLLQEAIRRRPDKADGWWNLAVALNLRGREAEARRALWETLRINPRYPAVPAPEERPPREQ